MSFRSWTATKLSQGGTSSWLLAMAIKFIIEGSLAVFFGFGISVLLASYTPISEIIEVYGANTIWGLRAILIGGIFYQVTYCEFTSLLENPEHSGEQNQDTSAESDSEN